MIKNKIIITLILSTTLAFSFDFGSILKDTVSNIQKKASPNTQTTNTLESSTVTSGLKEALKIGVNYGVSQLSKKDGYLNNLDVKIPLPKNLQTTEKLIRKAGGDKIIDDLVLSMNKAATQAAPQTIQIFLNAVDKITLEDSKKILSGDDNAATKYFKKHTLQPLSELIKPIVKKSMEDNKVVSYYDSANNFYKSNIKNYVDGSSIMEMAKNYGVDKYIPNESDVSLDDYVTANAIDGLFKMIAKKEQAIRKNPKEQTTSLLKKVFGN